MKSRYLVLLVFLVAACASTSKEVSTRQSVRTMKSEDPSSYHNEINLQVGWFEYDESALELVEPGVYVESFSDSTTISGKMPVIVLSYPDSGKTFTFGMDVDNELLGKLLKHSLMSEIPVQRPLSGFLERSDCSKCHPSDIPIKE